LDSRPHNLPQQLSSFVGREDELETLGRLVIEKRQVTVLGPGGVGKTRLALQVAADQIEQFRDGVFFVDLAPLQSAEPVIPSLASTIGLREEPHRSLAQTLEAHLRERSVLLVLDNLEHLLPAAGKTVTELVAAAPELHILATSRAPLHIRGEQLFDLPGLDAGRADRIEAEPPAAVALLLERARAIGIDLELTPEVGPLVSAICARLDGLPLAIELAAARLRIFSITELHEALASGLSLGGGASDLPERQRTLRATIAWTEELLSPTARTAFARLGVFAGGFTLTGAAEVVDDTSNIEDIVMSLVDQSLVRRLGVVAGVSRFGMLEMVREYAVERLEESLGGDEAREGLASYALKLAEELEPALVGAGQEAALQRLDAELANVRLALGWARDCGDDRLGHLTASLTRYWAARGLLSEGRRWVRESQAASSHGDPIVAARLLHADGMLATDQGELSEGAGLLRAAADIYRVAGDRGGLTRVLVTLSSALQAAGILDEAMVAATEAAELAHGLGDLRSEASATGNLAIIALKQGRVSDAQAGIARAVEMLKRAGDRLGVVIGLGNLGAIAAQAGNFEQAIEYQTEALSSAIALSSPDLEAWARVNLANAMYRRGDRTNAAPLAAAAIEQLVAVEDTIAVVNALPFAAALLATSGDTRTALTAWSAAESNADRMGIELEVDEGDRSTIAALRGTADASTLDACAREGATLAPDEAAALVVARLRSATVLS